MSNVPMKISLSGLLVLLSGTQVHAQLPSLDYEPLNRLGRAFGFGLSDGYHECKPAGLPQSSHMGSQLFETATFPSHGHGAPRSYPVSYPVPMQPGCATCNTGMPSYAAPVIVPTPVAPMQVPQAVPQMPSVPSPIYSEQVPPPIQPKTDYAPIPNTFVPLDIPTIPRSSDSPSDQAVPKSSELQRVPEPELIPAPQSLREGSAAPQPPAVESDSSEDEDELLIPDQAMQRQPRYRNAYKYKPAPINRYMR